MTLTATIRSRIVAAIRHFMKQVDPSFRENSDVDKTVEGAFATVLAPEIKQTERLGEQATREGCPLTASSPDDNDLGQLYNWGRFILGRMPDAAREGTYTVTITGAGEIPAGAMLVDPTTDLVYLLQAKVTAPGTGTIKSTGAGVEVALDVGDTLNFDQRYTGVDSEVTVASVVVSPLDKETDAAYLEAIKNKKRATPRGGAAGDYRVWCDEVPGVLKVYPYSDPYDLGNIRIYVQCEKNVNNPNGIPDTPGDPASTGITQDVEDEIALVEPLTAGSTYVSPILGRAATVTIYGLSDSALESDIEDLIGVYMYAKEPYIAGLDREEERKDRVSRAELFSTIQAAILPATISDVNITVGGASWNETTLPMGSVIYPDEVIFSV